MTFDPPTSQDDQAYDLPSDSERVTATISALPLPAGAATDATLASVVTAVREAEATVLLNHFEQMEWAGA